MSDLDILNQMIKDDAKVPLTNNYGKPSVTLSEPQSNSSNYSVTIKGMPVDSMVIKADAFQSPKTIFVGSKGECKRADFVIIAEEDNKKRILCIEIKKTKGSRKEIIQQLSGAQCFVHYCQEIGRMFWKEKEFLKDYHYRFVSFQHISIPKKPTKMRREAKIHDTPEKMMTIDGPHHTQFNRLVGS